MNELSTAAVDAARLYGEIKKETINELVATISPQADNLHFGGFVFYADSRYATISRTLKATWHLEMRLNGNDEKLAGVVEYDLDTMPDKIGEEIWKSVLARIKNQLHDACVPVITRSLGLIQNQ